MHIEFRHLRTIKAIHETGSVAGAAQVLNITQSALSHQIKAIEDQVGVELFVRRSKPLKLSAAGGRMLAAADRILPEMEALEAEFEAVQEGSLGRLFVGVETAAALDWMLPVLGRFCRIWPQVELDLVTSRTDPFAALLREELDMIITTETVAPAQVAFVPLFDYEPLIFSASGQEITSASWVEPRHFANLTLIDYPVAWSRSDACAALLAGSDVRPIAVRQVEKTEVILMLVAAGQGVAVLPDWVLRQLRNPEDFAVKRLAEGGTTRRINAAVRNEDVSKPYLAHLLRLARQEAVRLQRP